MEPQWIKIRGARMHNLKNISVDLPRNRLVVLTGVSGSGKSTLAFDTLYAEGQRRYVESLSTYARQFLEQMAKPDVDSIEGLSPAVSIEQRSASRNPRSTVGTVTEIHDYLRLLFARVGRPFCPECGEEIKAQSLEQMADSLLSQPEGARVMLMAPLVAGRKGEHQEIFARLRKEGYVRVRVDGAMRSLNEEIVLDRQKRHTIEVVVDRLVIKPDAARRLRDSVATAVKLADGFLLVHWVDEKRDALLSEKAACIRCGRSLPELTPQLFSFNNPKGACPDCGGLGLKVFFDPELVIPDPSLSIRQGALAFWRNRATSSYFGQILQALADHYGFNLDTPFAELPPAAQEVILHGTGDEEINVVYERNSRRLSFSAPYEGILPHLTRRRLETTSALVREDLEQYMSEQVCPACNGARLRPEALAVRIGDWSIHHLGEQSIHQLLTLLPGLAFDSGERLIAGRILKEVSDRLTFLADVGLGYLSLNRKAETLSGGEAQRIRLATQVGSRLVGVLYILDEPSIGLHQRDNLRLIATLSHLRDLGNTVVVVEHDSETIVAADHVLDMGPAAGVHGGEIVYNGDVQGLLNHPDSKTGAFLSGRLVIPIPDRRRPSENGWLVIREARANNLQGITVSVPLGLMTCVTGVSGSGKSSLVIDTLFQAALRRLHGRNSRPGIASINIEGLERIDKVIDIDQSPIGRTPRSNPATYTGVLAPIRDLLARLPEARARGYKGTRFSFNVKGGRCEACEGDGVRRIAMHFLPDLFVTCETCEGRRYNRDTLEIKYRGRNIADILAMTVAEALAFFTNIPPVQHRLQTLFDVGLGYITLGQAAPTLSGGEAQRIKLARELSKKNTGRTLYILDEPTTGLHPADILYLLDVLAKLVENGSTVVVIEHNLDVIKTADYIIDLGPEGGNEGGKVVAMGTPEEIAGVDGSYTGQFLRKVLG